MQPKIHPSYGLLSLTYVNCNYPLIVGEEYNDSGVINVDLHLAEMHEDNRVYPRNRLLSLGLSSIQLALLASSVNTDTYIPCTIYSYINNGELIDGKTSSFGMKRINPLNDYIKSYFSKFQDHVDLLKSLLELLDIDDKIKQNIMRDILSYFRNLKSNSEFSGKQLLEIFNELTNSIMIEINNIVNLNHYKKSNIEIMDTNFEIKEESWYGVIQITNVKSEENALFGSSFMPINNIKIDVYKAYEIKRESISYYKPINEIPIYSILMSFEEWSFFLFRPNYGTGGKCTIKSICGVDVDDCPEQNSPILDFLDNNKVLIELNKIQVSDISISLNKLIRSRKIDPNIKIQLNELCLNIQNSLKEYSEYLNNSIRQLADDVAVKSQIKIKDHISQYDLLIDMVNNKLSIGE